MTKYLKKPVEVEAIQWDGKNLDECEKFVGKLLNVSYGVIMIKNPLLALYVDKDDWIVKNANGDLYTCKSGIFAKAYEKI